MKKGNIPVLLVSAPSLAEAWEKSLLSLWENGVSVRTDYDEKDEAGRYLHPPSKDCSMCIIVEDPASEPLIHRCFPGDLEALEEYRMEVVEGIKDHWLRDPSDPEDRRWDYTYHGRLFAYDIPGAGEGTGEDPRRCDQIETSILGPLSRSLHTRRANAITWQPWRDPFTEHPPCMQSLWCRVLEDDEGTLRFNMNVRFRSRDAYDAAFMNMFALLSLQEHLASALSKRIGRGVKPGRYVDWSDSYHIYGRRFESFEKGFLRSVQTRSFEQRTWTRSFAQPIFEEARPRILQKIKEKDRQGGL